MNTTLIKARSRVSWSPEERAEWLRLFEQSEQTAAEFCRDNGLSPATLSLWRQQAAEDENTDSALVQVSPDLVSALAQAPAQAASTPSLSVTLPSGLRFEVPMGLDTAWFGQLLQSLINARV
jgi:transposase-like protein